MLITFKFQFHYFSENVDPFESNKQSVSTTPLKLTIFIYYQEISIPLFFWEVRSFWIYIFCAVKAKGIDVHTVFAGILIWWFFFLRLYPISNYLVYSMHLLPFIMVALSSMWNRGFCELAHSFSDWLLHVVSISILWRVHDKRKMRFHYWLCNFETTAIKYDKIGTLWSVADPRKWR